MSAPGENRVMSRRGKTLTVLHVHLHHLLHYTLHMPRYTETFEQVTGALELDVLNVTKKQNARIKPLP